MKLFWETVILYCNFCILKNKANTSDQLRWVVPVRNVLLSSHMDVPPVPRCGVCSFSLPLKRETRCQSRRANSSAPRKCDTDLHEWQGALLKTVLPKKRKKRNSEPAAAALLVDRWVWKNRSCTAEVCPSLWETLSNWRIIPLVLPALWVASVVAVV